MNKISIGLVLNQLIKEKGYSVVHVAERLKKARQVVYGDLKRTAMKDEQIEEYAKALGVDKQLIYDRWDGKQSTTAAGTDVLGQQVEALEQFFKDQVEFQRQQIESQQRTIESQQETIKMLLGKSEGVSIKTPGSSSVALPATVYGFGYTHARG